MRKRTHDPIFPIDSMGTRQQMPKGFAPQNIRPASGDELVGGIGLAALEPLGPERATEPRDVSPHPAFQPSER